MGVAMQEWQRWLKEEATEAGRQAFAPIVEYFDEAGREAAEVDPFGRDPDLIASLWPLLKLTQLAMGAEVRGFENLPKGEPALIVGNHSGGAFTLDPLPLMMKWLEHRGSDAPLYALTYQLLFGYPGVGDFLRRLGCLPASHETARNALDKGANVIVFPGGDYEVFRPWKERNRVDFGGRMGFIELALNAGVPVVPMTIHGAHESTFVLTRGNRIARELGLDKLRVKVFPIVWNLPFGIAPAFMPSIQLPSRITVQIGQPMRWFGLGPEDAEDTEILHRCYEQVIGNMQRTMDGLAAEHPRPVLTRLNDLRPSRMARRTWRALAGD